MTGLIGGRWTAGNRLEPSRPNGRGRNPHHGGRNAATMRGRPPLAAAPVGGAGSGAARARRRIPPPGACRFLRHSSAVSLRAGRAGDRTGGVPAGARVARWRTGVACGVGRSRSEGNLGGWGAPVAESALAPPGPIPNPVVTQRSAGEYCGGDPTGGEAAAGAPHPRNPRGVGRRTPPPTPPSTAAPGSTAQHPSRGGAAAARWAHNPKVGGSNPSPATNAVAGTERCRPRLFAGISGTLEQFGVLAGSRGARDIASLRSLCGFVIDTVYPKRCAGCDRRGTWLCDECERELELFVPPWCLRCGIPAILDDCRCAELPLAVAQARSAGPYEGWLRGAIVNFKYHGEWSRSEHLGPVIANALDDLMPIDALVPVPLHPARIRQRGFNQSEVLARAAAELIGSDVCNALIRTRRTLAQVHLGAAQRAENMVGAFSLNPGVTVAGQRLVLIDDVMTTGATLGSCAAVLVESGALSVSVASLAREL